MANSAERNCANLIDNRKLAGNINVKSMVTTTRQVHLFYFCGLCNSLVVAFVEEEEREEE